MFDGGVSRLLLYFFFFYGVVVVLLDVSIELLSGDELLVAVKASERHFLLFFLCVCVLVC